MGPDADEAFVPTADMLRAEDILIVFEQRGIHLDDKARGLIEACTDPDTLNGWFRRAFKVDRASGLFEE